MKEGLLQIISRAHPGIASFISDLWGTVGCSTYINELIKSIEKDPEKLPPEVLGSLLNLKALHETYLKSSLLVEKNTKRVKRSLPK